jgi:hypothetical protein
MPRRLLWRGGDMGRPHHSPRRQLPSSVASAMIAL